MSGLEDLYREIILDHYRTPRNRGELDPPATRTEGHNPLCGDEITVYLALEGTGDEAIVSDIKISGQGCSISQSSASMMTQAVLGKPIGDVKAVLRRFKAMMGVESADAVDADDDIDLGDLEALQGVVKFPVRIKCAVLGWNTLASALDEAGASATD
ncbi:MAG: Fe-S cluster assembly sulfur transfer protein SufU [Ilumatobacter sp.]|jgi:nitrogen fixation protein NifU and related proteins|uniref:Fe-S cluster assembly sulfur transfer protein SufU n=1 Tax=Ilumatobacter sp. TaxID=1967498 RepID=UPI00391DBA0B